MSFRDDINRFGNKTEMLLAEITKETTLVTRERIAKRTPILTGRASASWNASKNEPDTRVQPPTFNNPGQAPFLGQTDKLDGFMIGDTGFVSNSIHYIGNLNAGSSQKAPAGFVEATALELELTMPEVVARIRRKYGL